MTSTDAAIAVRALEADHAKRLLRSYHGEDKGDEGDGDEEDDEEERGVMTPEQVRKWGLKAKKWVNIDKETPAPMVEKLTGLSGAMSFKNQEKYALFMDYWKRKNP
ncbi:unnamed protein product [Phytophthora lilii]|uniref:Unnamed protein product n=1 Tax=Phytophthora lilii TaxID=2077276 RepID=A0A9W6TTW7_9STRA|nr:unnamed protein product [Phytophthora lilii]